MLLLRSDREWRLPRVRLPGDVWAAEADRLVPAFAERLGTAPFLVRQLGFAAEPTVELALREEWAAPRHGRWAGLDDLDRLRLRDDERQTVSQYLRDDGLETRRGGPPGRGPAGKRRCASGSVPKPRASATRCAASSR